MKVLQFCCFSNWWPSAWSVESIDIKFNKNILDLPDNYGKSFDLIVSAPPCTQFTKANSLGWVVTPDYFIEVARKCFVISVTSGKPWFLENPPGRIEKFIPELSQFRVGTWHGIITNKEYIIYSSFLIMLPVVQRYGKKGSVNNLSKIKRDLWQPDFIDDILRSL